MGKMGMTFEFQIGTECEWDGGELERKTVNAHLNYRLNKF